MNVRDLSARSPRGLGTGRDGTTTLRDQRALSLSVTDAVSSHTDVAREQEFAAWLERLDETCTLVRHMALKAGVAYHVGRLRELAREGLE